MSDKVLRLGLVGAGNNAAHHHLPAYRTIPGVEVAACCATTLERAEAGARRMEIPHAYSDVTRMIREAALDAVCICSTNDAHYRNTLDALTAGAHVLCEKPMALDSQEAQEMCAAAHAAGRVAMVAFTYRFAPAAAMAKELIVGGTLGRIFALQATYVSAYLAELAAVVEKPWKLRRGQGGGVLRDLGSHLIDLTRWWLGEVRRVSATAHSVSPERVLPDGTRLTVDVEDACSFSAEFESGAVGSYFVTKYATGRGNFQRIEIYGQAGALSYCVERPGELDVCLGPDARSSGRWTTLEVPARFGQSGTVGSLEGYRLQQARAFVRAIREGGNAEPSFEDGLACQRILDVVAAAAARPAWKGVTR